MHALRFAVIGFLLAKGLHQNPPGSSRSITATKPPQGRPAQTFFRLIRSATKRVDSWGDLSSILFMATAPVLYLLRFRGLIKTPFGYVRITNNEVLGWFLYGFYKTKFGYLRTLKRISFRTSPETVLVDVGANLGDFTLAFGGKTGLTVSIEPGRENFALLESNLRANSNGRFLPLNLAAHDSNETLTVEGNGGHLRVSPNGGTEQVLGAPLDEIFRNYLINHVDLLKIDVQGHELRVLHGTRKSFETHLVDLVIVEVHDVFVQSESVSSYMKSKGYRLVAKDSFIQGQPQLYFKATSTLS